MPDGLKQGHGQRRMRRRQKIKAKGPKREKTTRELKGYQTVTKKTTLPGIKKPGKRQVVIKSKTPTKEYVPAKAYTGDPAYGTETVAASYSPRRIEQDKEMAAGRAAKKTTVSDPRTGLPILVGQNMTMPGRRGITVESPGVNVPARTVTTTERQPIFRKKVERKPRKTVSFKRSKIPKGREKITGIRKSRERVQRGF